MLVVCVFLFGKRSHINMLLGRRVLQKAQQQHSCIVYCSRDYNSKQKILARTALAKKSRQNNSSKEEMAALEEAEQFLNEFNAEKPVGQIEGTFIPYQRFADFSSPSVPFLMTRQQQPQPCEESLFEKDFDHLNALFDSMDSAMPAQSQQQASKIEKEILHLLKQDDKVQQVFGTKFRIENKTCSLTSSGPNSFMEQQFSFIGKSKRRGRCTFQVQFNNQPQTRNYRITSVSIEYGHDQVVDKWNIDLSSTTVDEKSCDVIECEFVQK